MIFTDKEKRMLLELIRTEQIRTFVREGTASRSDRYRDLEKIKHKLDNCSTY